MNIILSAINTKHTHSALALACLKSYWDKYNSNVPLTIKEFDLNILDETIINDLLLLQPDILAFSTYIWSINRIIAVSSAIKACYPNCKIILGGPEVSFNSESILNKYSCIDFIIRGEGEVTFKELLESLLNCDNFESVKGITYRSGNLVLRNPERPFVKVLDELPSPFTTGNYKGTASFTYYEASRGCPSKCAYCLSSVQGNVRNHSIVRIKEDLDWFFQSDFDQIRFADRTFNYDIPRAKEILNYIKKGNTKNKNFHFEIQADFLSQELIELLSDAPRGIFHLEIGVQSTNPKALSTVHRKFDIDGLKANVNKLRNQTNCYLHLDVLGGLPYDTYADFCKSLDDVASLKPEDIQISMVKVLHGTPYEYMAKKGQMYYMSEPPYTVLKTDWLKPAEAVMISQISKLVEGISNTGRFNNSLEYLINKPFVGSFSKLFESMVLYWRQNKLLFYNFSPENTVKHLKEYSKSLDLNISDQELFESKLEHELRLVLRASNADNWEGPLLPEISKKPEYKLETSLKCYWYKSNPFATDSNKSIKNYPVVYQFTKSETGSPSVEYLKLALSEAFLMICIQKKLVLDSIPDFWKRLYPTEPTPDFTMLLEKLMSERLILFTAHR